MNEWKNESSDIFVFVWNKQLKSVGEILNKNLGIIYKDRFQW